jgi:vancomycin resistance protein YoaR
VPRGTTVQGVHIGGLSQAAAAAKVEQVFGPRAARPIAVKVGGKTDRLDPAVAGVRLDARGTVAQAGSRSWNPVTLVKALVGDHSAQPLAVIDDAKLGAALDDLAARTGTRPVDGDVTFTAGRVVRVEPKQGVRLDVPTADERLAASYLSTAGPIQLATTTANPRVGADEVDRAVAEFGDPAMSGPVTLTIGGRTVTITPVAVSPALSMAPDGNGRLQPQLDVAVLRRALAGQLKQVEAKARDATFRIVGRRPVVVPAVTGHAIADAQLSAAVLDALASTDNRSRSLSLSTAQPTLTTAAAQALGVTEQVSSFETFYPSDFKPRLTNIHRAADLLSGALVLPGATFSLNNRIGERTKARGFAEGFIINKGQLEVDFGGGVSQVATTTFNAMYFAGLQDVEHHPHSFYISRYPEGREATIAWGSKDLRFTNDSGHGIFVTTSYTNRSIRVTMWGTKRFTAVTSSKGPRTDVKPFPTQYDPRPEGTTSGSCVHQDGVVGFRVNVTRRLFQGSTLVASQTFSTRYDPEARIICGSTGPATTATPTR